MLTGFSLALRAAVALLAAASCMAQSITGVVYDQDGAVVPNARVFLMEDYVKQQETSAGVQNPGSEHRRMSTLI